MLLATAAHSAVDINIVAGSGLSNNQAALDAFERGAALWESMLQDSIVVNIDADLSDLGSPTTIGQAGSVVLQTSFDDLRNAMVADAAAEPDDALVASLPTSAQFQAFLPAGITLSGNLSGTKANLKALGFAGLDDDFGLTDATITFNSIFNFDYDNSDGVTPGSVDFETVAAHEIGHALGFVSIVDTIDFMLSQGATGSITPRTMDLFRFQDGTGSDPASLSEFTTFARNLMPNTAANIDVLNAEWALSTGAFTGDGRQASHWRDDQLSGIRLGVMDPTLGAEMVWDISTADFRVMDLIGYDLLPIPEPGSLMFVGVALWMLRMVRRPSPGKATA